MTTKLNGTPLWEVSVRYLNVNLWITGPLGSVQRKAKVVLKREHGIKRPQFTGIVSRGTLDA